MKKQAFAKTDVRHWKEKVFKRDRGGSVDRDFTVQVQYRGRREKLPLGTTNKEVAAKRACDIYSTLHAEGWKPVLQKWKPSHTTQEPSDDMLEVAIAALHACLDYQSVKLEYPST